MTCAAQPGPWILTAAGMDQPLTGPALLRGAPLPGIQVLAHSLSQINRFTGHTLRPYSVAEHSLLVCDIAAEHGLDCHGQMLALLHDAHEALCGDATSPVKAALGTAWLQLENPLALAVRSAYGLRSTQAQYARCVRFADLRALATERRDLTYFEAGTNLPWPAIDSAPQAILPMADVQLMEHRRTALTWRDWRGLFLDKFHHLQTLRGFADPLARRRTAPSHPPTASAPPAAPATTEPEPEQKTAA